MPGTIQVSVLDFKSLHSSSQISIKVSMGKREYQTWDKGDFSFPLTTLRDNLIITLQDAEGNEISHTGIETRLVVEKGVWDEIFSLEGCGHVHMKLQFVLSEEERQRIRIMREYALKKKQDELCNSGHGSPISASLRYKEVSANEASLASLPVNFFNDSKLDIDNRDRSCSIQMSTDTNHRDEKEGNSSVKSMLHAVNIHQTEKCQQDSSELEKANNSKEQGPTGKAHSNVRKMISAFEGSLNQDIMKPSIKPPPTKSQTRKIGMDSFLANSHLNEVDTEKITPPKVTLERINAKELQQTKICVEDKVQRNSFVKPIYEAASFTESQQLKESTAACSEAERKILVLKNKFKVIEKESEGKEEKKYSKDFRRTLEKDAFSHRMLNKHSTGNQSWNLFSKKQHCSRNLVTKGGQDEIFRKDPREADESSNEKLKSMAIWSDDHCSIGSSGLWIFPGESKCLCITTGGTQIVDIMGGLWDGTNTNQRKLSACDPKSRPEVNADAGTDIEENEDEKTSCQKLENSMDPEDSIGPVGQVIRVIIMVGFATLVILTRKRTYR